jgi:hypothetical protein
MKNLNLALALFVKKLLIFYYEKDKPLRQSSEEIYIISIFGNWPFLF